MSLIDKKWMIEFSKTKEKRLKTRPDLESKNKTIMLIGAHPDDSEFRACGTAIKMHDDGARIVIVTISDGSAGHYRMDRKDLAARRRAEAMDAASLVDGKSISLGIADGEVEPSLANRDKLIALIRSEAPDVIITNRANDYHPDHRYTAQLVQDASYMLMVPNVCPGIPPLRYVPLILYWGDQFKRPVEFSPDVVISIDDVLERKLDMLSRHESQVFEWLAWVDNMLDSVPPSDDKDGRMAFLMRLYQRRPNHLFSERFRPMLLARYGENGQSVVEAEAFEMSEYGYQATEEELGKLFMGY